MFDLGNTINKPIPQIIPIIERAPATENKFVLPQKQLWHTC